MDTADTYAPIRKGLLELAVLTIIRSRKVYAVDILRTLANSEFSTQDGTLYPLLSRLRRANVIQYEWVESEHGPPRKYYRLTPDGLEHLHNLEAYVRLLQETLSNFTAGQET